MFILLLQFKTQQELHIGFEEHCTQNVHVKKDDE